MNNRLHSVKSTNKILGENIKDIRKLKNISQKELASGIGVSYQQIQKYEDGTNSINIHRLCLMIDFLNVSLADLFDGLPINDNDNYIGDLKKIKDPLLKKIINQIIQSKNKDLLHSILTLLQAMNGKK